MDKVYKELLRQKENYEKEINNIKKETKILQGEFISELEGTENGINVINIETE